MNPILSRLVQIGGLTGLVALVCETASIDSNIKKYVIFSSLILFSILVIVPKRSVRISLKTILCAGVLIGVLTTVLYFNQSENQVDFRMIDKSNDFLAELDSHYMKASREVWMVGTSFHLTATNNKELFKELLSRGIDIRILQVDPNNERIVGQIAEHSGLTIEQIKSKTATSLSFLRQFEKTSKSLYGDGAGQLEIRLLEEQPFFRGYFIDPRTETVGCSFIAPYLNKGHSSDTFGLFLSNATNDIAHQYISSFVALWKSAKEVP